MRKLTGISFFLLLGAMMVIVYIMLTIIVLVIFTYPRNDNVEPVDQTIMGEVDMVVNYDSERIIDFNELTGFKEGMFVN